MRTLPFGARTADAAVAAAVIALAEAEVLTGQVPGPLWAAVLSGVLIGTPLAVQHRLPWAALVTVYGTFVGAWAVGVSLYNYLATVIAGLVVLYAFASTMSRWPAVAGLVLAYAATAVSALGHSADNAAWGLVLLGGAWLAGRAVRSRRLLIDELRAVTRELQLSRDENARAAVHEERTRIARELHDIVAHAVSVIVVQAGAAERVLDSEPAQAREPLRAVQDSGRQALAELRRLLDVLRPNAPAALTPQPGLGDLPALAATFREAGLDVQLRQRGALDGLPAGVDLAAYRIVQEALTNALKHSPGGSAEVRLRCTAGSVEVEVVNAGLGSVRRAGAGHGLIGMRERASIYGGEFEAGPQDGGGYRVHARIPVPTSG